MNKAELQNLLDGFKKVKIGNLPTPLIRLRNFESRCGLGNIYMKRDEMSENPGGNKIRHLEYLLGDAIQKGHDSFIISGPIQSNFCSAAVLACNRINFPCTVLHNCDKSHDLTGNNLLNNLMGANQHFLGEMSFEDLAKSVLEFGEKLKKQGENPYVFHTDYSKAVAALGYVECVLELLQQCEMESIEINDIFVPVGNGIFAGGLVFGNALLNMPFSIRLVSVEFNKDEAEKNIEDLIYNMENLTGVKIEQNLDDIAYVYDDYNGGGWGISTSGSIAILKELAETEGIFLEKIYTSKGFYGMIDLLQKGAIESSGSCYINSGGFPSLFAQF